MAGSRVGILFGGPSAEHEVSVMSAREVVQGLLAGGHQVVPVGITLEGRAVTDGEAWSVLEEGAAPVVVGTNPRPLGEVLAGLSVDAVFPVLHGPGGEDGSIQGMLEWHGLPYVGAGVGASAVSLDKAVMKAVFVQRGLPVGPYRVFDVGYGQGAPDAKALSDLRFPVFVKPARLGSSIGVTRVEDPRDLPAALRRASRHDAKVVVEEELRGREVEVGVIGNRDPVASLPGEVVVREGFYDYHAKYEPGGAELHVPAHLPPQVEAQVRELAVAAFCAVGARGLARVDFFVLPGDAVVVNEINTMPGFTRLSMFPRVWEASGLPYPELLNRLVQLALESAGMRQGIEVGA